METKTHKIKKLRYLAPEYVCDPNEFIKDVVKSWNINWSLNFGFLFSYSMCPMLDKNRVFDYGFTYLHLAQMIDAAYSILKTRNWTATSKKKLFYYQDAGEITGINQKENINAQQLICDFFGFMNLYEWYDFLDDLLLSSDVRNTADVDIRADHLIAREFIVLLPDALLQIHKENAAYFNP
ncbi:hypothetical protein ORI89_16000 [Sphingobacterium sp. UT-1RO-CII-1]|uniref:hypothetical protein n=1 Tax=Sphingobacterium sp. UT-1RO-CII-1 TaxID=2995225 RepID=UPI00227B0B40|nr:hypothetical protein [Sphingobacterium sp. UT-1RO-CII-1]MCY4781165.1 hypothetical protein [Sphingobacterium sp. UT-1RO-CII-1]